MKNIVGTFISFSCSVTHVLTRTLQLAWVSTMKPSWSLPSSDTFYKRIANQFCALFTYSFYGVWVDVALKEEVLQVGWLLTTLHWRPRSRRLLLHSVHTLAWVPCLLRRHPPPLALCSLVDSPPPVQLVILIIVLRLMLLGMILTLLVSLKLLLLMIWLLLLSIILEVRVIHWGDRSLYRLMILRWLLTH